MKTSQNKPENKILKFMLKFRRPIAFTLITAIVVVYVTMVFQYGSSIQSLNPVVLLAEKKKQDEDDLTIQYTKDINAKKYDEALKDVDKLLRLDDSNGSYYLKRASLYILTNDKTRALADVNTAIQIAPKMYDAYSLRASLYEESQNYKAAIADYKTMHELYPSNNELLIYIADSYQQLSDYTNAVKAYDEAEKALPQSYLPAITYARGACYYSLEDYNDALKDLTVYLKSDPTDNEANFLIGSCYMNLDQEDSAAPYLTISAKSGDHISESSYYLGIINLDNEKYDNAVSFLSIAIDGKYMTDYALYNRAICYLALGKNDLAKIDLQKSDSMTQDTGLKKSINEILVQLT